MAGLLQLAKSYFNAKQFFICDTIAYHHGSDYLDCLALDLKQQILWDCLLLEYTSNRLTEVQFHNSVKKLYDFRRYLKLQTLFQQDFLSSLKIQKTLIISAIAKREYWQNCFKETGIFLLTSMDMLQELKSMTINQKLLQDDPILMVIKNGKGEV